MESTISEDGLSPNVGCATENTLMKKLMTNLNPNVGSLVGKNELETMMLQDDATDLIPSRFSEIEVIRYIYRNLPGVKYITDQLIGFIFSTQLYAEGSDNKLASDEYTANGKYSERFAKRVRKTNSDKILQKFLMSKNVDGDKNLDLLRKATLESLVYGDVGIRFLSKEDGLLIVPTGTYMPIYVKSKQHHGVKQIAWYAINVKGELITETNDNVIEKIDEGDYELDVNGVMKFKDTDIIVISPKHFQTIENVPINGIHRSPLMNDVNRIVLLLKVYKQLIDDLANDGPGRIVTFADTSLANEVGISAGGDILDSSDAGIQERQREIEAIVMAIMRKFKNSTSRDVLTLNEFFKDKIVHLPRTTKATEFLNFRMDEIEIICQLFGVPPQLLGAGRILGNISMEMIITNSMVNVIIPMRQRYASKISNLLSPNLEVGEVKFHAENYADKSRYEDTAQLGLLVERLHRGEQFEAVEQVTELISDILDRSKTERDISESYRNDKKGIMNKLRFKKAA